MSEPRTIPHQSLENFVQSVLVAMKAPQAKARLVAESLVAANLRGVDSHGVHLLPHYVAQLRAGNIDPAAEGHVVSENGGCLVYDAEHALGQRVSEICCGHAVRLARAQGLGMVVARESNHFGAAAYWGLRISREGMVGMVFSNASPSVPPWQGTEGRVGTNPICVSLPSGSKGGWLLDMATTTVAMNKIVRAAANRQSTIPYGWAMDADGVPTTETKNARLLMPLGGYKGSGLGMMVEILCGVLSGGMMSTAVGGVHLLGQKMHTSHCFLAIDVERFMPIDEFQSRMEHLVTTVKTAEPAVGYDEVLVAGDPEWRIEAKRLESGIPVDGATWERFTEISTELAVPLP